MEMVTINTKVYQNTTTNRIKVKLNLLKGNVKNIPSRSPMFERVKHKRILSKIEKT